MIDFAAVLTLYTRGKAKFAQVNHTLDKLLSAHPEHAEDYLDALYKVHSITPLPAKAFNAFNSKLTDTIRRRVVANDPQGGPSLDFEFADDGAVQSAPQPAPKAKPRPKPAPASGDDATVLKPQTRRRKQKRPEPAPTRLNPSVPQAHATPQPRKAESQSIGPGSIIKDRFKLVELLGQGGMGLVYKAEDRLKVEAQDRNPYVAVKLLTEDFREFPESFIALQRESSKAQRLAHPNIGTVFDFDRDGDLIYMTMELLEGQELKEYINDVPLGGLAVADALPVIEGLSNALSYAHENGLIHSDFKPGNAFVTKGGGIKVIDFGIARASKTRAGAGDKTVFDPGSLGGLTPSYATVEMFDGKDPHPSDDIYALACITYELLAGKHPYNRTPAPKAREQRLRPDPIKKLNGRQQKGLLKALAFEREDRTQNIEEFLDHIRPRKSYVLPISIGSAAAAILLAVLLYNPIQNYFLAQEYQQIIVDINSGDTGSIERSLTLISPLDSKAQKAITSETRDALLTYYQQKIDAALSEANGYDFAGADVLLSQAEKYYEDSARLLEIGASVTKRKEDLLKDFDARIKAHVASGALLPDENSDDMTDVLTRLDEVFPGELEKSKPQLVQAYKTQVNRAIDGKNYVRAAQFIAVAETFGLADERIVQQKDRVVAELLNGRRAQQAREAQQRLQAAQQGFRSLATYREHLADIATLRANRPNDRLLRGIDDQFQKRYAAAQSGLVKAKDWARAEALLLSHAQALPLDFLRSQRAALSAAQRSSGASTQIEEANRNAFLDQRLALDDLAATAVFDLRWYTALNEGYRRALVLAPENSAELQGINTRLVNLHLDTVTRSLEQERHVRAEMVLREGLRVFPGQSTLVAEKSRLDKQKVLAELKEKKQTLVEHAQANDVQAARNLLTELKRQLAADDAFINTTAPQAIGDAYLRLAAGKSPDQAVKFLQAGLNVAPNYAPLRDAMSTYTSALDEQRVRNLLARADSLDVADVRQRLTGLRKNNAEDYPRMESDFTALLAKRIKELERSNLRGAHALLAQGRELFPGSGRISQLSLKELPKPSQVAFKGISEAQAGRLTAATTIHEQAKTREPNHRDTLELANLLKTKKAQANDLYRKASSASNNSRYSQALSLLEQAAGVWRDNPDYASRRKEWTIAAEKIRIGARPCKPNFARLGRDKRAECQDVVGNRQKGPALVVIPAGGEVQKAFAISKYEITEGDFDAYCKSTGQCTPSGRNARSPKVSIDVGAAESYAKWLSAESGFEYRLPTHTEWLHAAQAGGREGNKEYNCQLKLSGKLVKGLAIQAATTGKPNSWGLVNYVGNVQELVRPTPGSVAAAGGSYKDSMSKCSTELNRGHNGSADPVTGFRLVRSLG